MAVICVDSGFYCLNTNSNDDVSILPMNAIVLHRGPICCFL